MFDRPGKPGELHSAALCRIAGLSLFAIAFFLPACDAAFPGSLRGYLCAWITFSSVGGFFQAHPDDLLATFLLSVSGWVNPLVLLYLLSVVWRQTARIRPVLVLAILLCLVTAWAVIFWGHSLIGVHLRPLIGHYLWTAGILLILAPEALRSKRTPVESCA